MRNCRQSPLYFAVFFLLVALIGAVPYINCDASVRLLDVWSGDTRAMYASDWSAPYAGSVPRVLPFVCNQSYCQ